MIETFLALMLAHAVADFMLQPDWMARGKGGLRPLVLHGLIVLIAAQVALGTWTAPEVLLLAGAHVVTDFTKARLFPRPALGPFLADQAVHVATVAALAALAPGLWSQGLWASIVPPQHMDLVLHGALTATGLILALPAGGYAVGLLMQPYSVRLRGPGLPNAGWRIGLLERALVYLFIQAGQPAGIGFLVAAKSVLRFGTAARDTRMSEYVIIGTLGSFGWALAVALFADWSAATYLPPLETGRPTP
jgi:hypothetical protein